MGRYRTVVTRSKSGKVVSVKSYTKTKSGGWTPAKANISPAGATASRAKRTGGGVSISKSGRTTYIPPEKISATPTPSQPTARITSKSTTSKICKKTWSVWH